MNSIDEILEDSPIFLHLSKPDLILTTAIIALSITEHDYGMLPELPEEMDHAISLMDVPQKEQMLHWLTQRIAEQ